MSSVGVSLLGSLLSSTGLSRISDTESLLLLTASELLRDSGSFWNSCVFSVILTAVTSKFPRGGTVKFHLLFHVIKTLNLERTRSIFS